MAREAYTRFRAAFESGGENPYEFVELDVATRMGGVMLLVMAVFAVVATPLTPPDDAAGIAAVTGFVALCAHGGVKVLRRAAQAPPRVLLGAVYVMLAATFLYRAAAGEGVPFLQLLFVIAISACVVHPVRSALMVLCAATFVACTPLWGEHVTGATIAPTVNQLVVIWCFGLIAVAWMARVRGQRREAAANSALARIDALTSLQNRRALEEALPPAVSHHRRHNRPLSVLVCDLDDFKPINDTHGHQAGDDLLRKVAQSLTAALRLSDPCFRWGGDEFVAILPEAGFGEASDIAARVRETVRLSCRTPAGRPVHITVGAAQLGPGQSGEDLFKAADAALYEGKQQRKSVSLAVT